MKDSHEELFHGRLGTFLFVASLLSVAVLIVAPCFAGIAIFFDPNSAGVPNRVTDIKDSVPPERYIGATNVVVLNSSSSILTNNPSVLKWTGSAVELLTGGDLTAIANAQTAVQIASGQFRERVAKTNAISSANVNVLDMDGRNLKALAEVTMDEINVVRAELTIIKAQIQLARTNTTAFQSATNRSNFPMNALADRTMTQLRTAIQNKVTAQADNN